MRLGTASARECARASTRCAAQSSYSPQTFGAKSAKPAAPAHENSWVFCTLRFIDIEQRRRVSFRRCSVFDARSIFVLGDRAAVNLLAQTPTGPSQGILSTKGSYFPEAINHVSRP